MDEPQAGPSRVRDYRVATRLLQHMLTSPLYTRVVRNGLPDDAECVSLSVTPDGRTLVARFRSDAFDPVPEGGVVPAADDVSLEATESQTPIDQVPPHEFLARVLNPVERECVSRLRRTVALVARIEEDRDPTRAEESLRRNALAALREVAEEAGKRVVEAVR